MGIRSCYRAFCCSYFVNKYMGVCVCVCVCLVNCGVGEEGTGEPQLVVPGFAETLKSPGK